MKNAIPKQCISFFGILIALQSTPLESFLITRLTPRVIGISDVIL